MLVITVIFGQFIYGPQYIKADGGTSPATAMYVSQAGASIDFAYDAIDNKWFYFVPAEDTIYTITGYETGFDAYCNLYNAADTVNPLCSGDDENGFNFQISYALQRNVKYYLKVGAYDNNTGYFKITGGALATPGTIGFDVVDNYCPENIFKYGFTVTRDGGSVGAASVDYEVTGGTATALEDYTLDKGTLYFADGEYAKNIDMNIVNNMVSEPDETVELTLSNPQGLEGVSLGTSVATLNIIDDDKPGTFQFSPTSITVGEGAGSTALTVSRTNGSTGAVTVDYVVTGGTAEAGSDYETVNGTLSFADGETSKTIPINIKNDKTMESNETIEVALSNASSGILHGTDSLATVTIEDNDSVLQFASATCTAGEGDGTTDITVSRTGSTKETVSVDYAVTDGSATAGTDYTLTAGTLTFSHGEMSKKIPVTIAEDSLIEGDETVEVTLSNPGGEATLSSNNKSILTITDNDIPVPGTIEFSEASKTVMESDGSVDLTVNRTGGSDGIVAIDYTVSGTASNGIDYTLSNGTLSFADKECSKTIPLSILNDKVVESHENVVITLSNASNGVSIGALSTTMVTIMDDDSMIEWNPATVMIGEGDASANLTVTRTGYKEGTVTVDYEVTGGSATAGTDYTLASGTLSFAAGESSKDVTISILNDTLRESNETVEVMLTKVTGDASIGSSNKAILTIRDNDSVIQFDTDNVIASKGAESAGITVTRTGNTSEIATAAYTVTGGTAVSGTDYKLSSGTLTFAAGEQSKVISITDLNKNLSENKTVEITLNNVTGEASIGTKNHVLLTIQKKEVQDTTGWFPSATKADNANRNQKAIVKDGTSTIATIEFTRTSNADGVIEDSLIYSTSNIKQSMEEIKKMGKATAEIVIPDEKDEVSKSSVKLPQDSLSQLTEEKINLNIWTKNAAICLPALSIKKADSLLKDNLYFNLVPVKKEDGKKEILERAKTEALIQNIIKGSKVSVIGRPITIETNMPSSSVDIILPLTGVTLPAKEKERELYFDTLGVYIEHSDGTKELVKGDIVTFGNGILGIKFGIKKFSTFTILQSTALKEKSSLCKIAKVLTPSKAVISGKKITATVDSSVKKVKLNLTVSKKASWKLYKDSACTKEIEKGYLTLSSGKNKIYVKVIAEDGTIAKYIMVITRVKK